MSRAKKAGALISLAEWLLYPLFAVVNLTALYNPRSTAATVAGLVLFVVLMSLLPGDLDPVDLGPRVGRPIVAYLGGLLLTGAILVVWPQKAKPAG